MPSDSRDRDLDVVDELAVPDRLEDPVREAKGEHVLDRLLAEVVVDPEDLLLGEVAADQLRELAAPRPVSWPNGFSMISRTQPSVFRRLPSSSTIVGIAAGGTAR